MILYLPSLEELESESDESESDEYESDSVSELYESDDEYLLLFFFRSLDFFCLPLTWSSELDSEDVILFNFFFFSEKGQTTMHRH